MRNHFLSLWHGGKNTVRIANNPSNMRYHALLLFQASIEKWAQKQDDWIATGQTEVYATAYVQTLIFANLTNPQDQYLSQLSQVLQIHAPVQTHDAVGNRQNLKHQASALHQDLSITLGQQHTGTSGCQGHRLDY